MVDEVGYGALIRGNRDFRNLFVGRIASLFGDWFNLLAILAMLRAFGDDSAMGLAWVLIVKTLPGFVAPMAGVLADRLPRRALMIGADLGRFVVVLGLVSLAWWPSLAAVYVLVTLQTLLSTVYEPARQAMLPDLVSDRELTAANALSAASWSLMLAIGSALGGLFTDAFGWQAALVVDAASYLVSAAFLLGVRNVAVVRATGPGGLLAWLGVRDLVEGVRWMAGRPHVWTLALVKPLWQLTGARTLVLTLLGESVFLWAGRPLLGVTVLFVARGVGTGLGPIVARWFTRSDPVAMERAIGWSFVSALVFYVLVGLSPWLWLAALLVVLAHIGGATIWVFSTIRLQQLTPSFVRGRVFAAEHAGMTVVMAVATGVFGDLADRLEGWLVGRVQDVPLLAAMPPDELMARTLTVLMGLITLVPLAAWVGRYLWLGNGGGVAEKRSG